MFSTFFAIKTEPIREEDIICLNPTQSKPYDNSCKRMFFNISAATLLLINTNKH